MKTRPLARKGDTGTGKGMTSEDCSMYVKKDFMESENEAKSYLGCWQAECSLRGPAHDGPR